MLIKSCEVPFAIREYVRSILEKDIRTYSIDQKGHFDIHAPWHDGCSEYYRSFILKDGKVSIMNDNEVYYSGLDYNYRGERKNINIPSGCIVVKVSTYPMKATIYTSSDATLFLPSGTDFELTKDEIKCLYYARAYIASARPKFSDTIYASLMSKKFMKGNKSITLEGRNYLDIHKVDQSVVWKD